jgi:hypothetical protein
MNLATEQAVAKIADMCGNLLANIDPNVLTSAEQGITVAQAQILMRAHDLYMAYLYWLDDPADLAAFRTEQSDLREHVEGMMTWPGGDAA